jgi:hypothetical protein
VIPIRTLRTEATGLTEAQFVARHPDPALVIDAGDAGRPPGSDPMAWLGKTVADEDPMDTMAMLIDPGQTTTPEVDVVAAAARALVFFVHKAARVEDPPLFPDMVTIGRVPNNDIVLAFPTVSKVHAYLRCDASTWRLYDHRSRNGTFVGQRRLAPGGSHALEDGAMVHIGPSLTLTFLLPPSLYGLVRGASRESRRGG